MSQTSVKDKILNLQAELDLMKQALVKEPDFGVDDKNWRKVESKAKKIRKSVYQKYYGKK